jgi:hypothetical protein
MTWRASDIWQALAPEAVPGSIGRPVTSAAVHYVQTVSGGGGGSASPHVGAACLDGRTLTDHFSHLNFSRYVRGPHLQDLSNVTIEQKRERMTL